MFRAPLDSFFVARGGRSPRFVDELLSEDALRHTGWFESVEVQRWRQRLAAGSVGRAQRTMVHMGMVGVLASQLWYHTFIERLADLPAWQQSVPPAA